VQRDRVEIGLLSARVSRGAGLGTTALRLRLGSLLAGADLHPDAMSPSAILIVRRVVDPKPGGLDPSRGLLLDRAWEREMRQMLAAISRRATRPERGIIHGDCDAVLFVDEGEMLASLALDISRGSSRRWWWRSALRLAPDGGSMVTILLSTISSLPAAIGYLDRWGVGIEVAEALASGDAVMLLDAISAAFGIASYHDDPGMRPEPPAHSNQRAAPAGSEDDVSPVRSSMPSSDFQLHSDRNSSTERWSRCLPSAAVVRRIGIERATLLGIARAIHHEPAAARSASFARVVDAWKRELERESQPAFGDDPTIVTMANQTATAPADADKAHHDPPTATGIVNHTASRDQTGEPGAEASHEVGARLAPADDPFSNGAESFSPDPGPAALDGIATRLGGIFYLINLLRYLDLPDCFEREWGLASQAGAWGLLESIARVWLPADDDASAADPVWSLLASLDGRDAGLLPGADLPSEPSFHLPVAWLAHDVDDTSFIQGDDGNTLRLWRAHYLLVEVPINEADASVMADRELEAYTRDKDAGILMNGDFSQAPLCDPRNSLMRGAGEGMGRFLSLVVPFLRTRLASALGVVVTDDDFLWRLLHAPARVYASSTHIDIVMSMEDISLPVRLAGLDRDPGWAVEYGRVIQFHFE
jgi:hypothetical protein